MAKSSQHSLSRSLGALTRWTKITGGLQGDTDHGSFRLLVYNAHTLRISVGQEGHDFDDFSYAVVGIPEETTFQVADEGEALIVTTAALRVVVTKSPVRFSFQTPEQTIINEDDAAFGTSWNGGQVTTYKKLQDDERFIGLGEKTGPLDRRGQGYTNWNTDSFAYSTGTDPLYVTIPFYIGLHHHLAYGIFFDNSHKSFFNFGASNNRFSSFAADAGEMNYYFIHDTSVANIVKHYTFLTGRMEMPPLWSIGFQQCRYSYYPDKEVLTLANTFRDKDIPADVIVFDIHYMEQYKIFTWSKKDFPDPKTLLEQLRALGFQVVIMCDPGIKVEEGYPAYDDGVKHDVFIKYPDGTNYSGQVWPGWCHFPDFTNPKARQWWQDQFQEYVDLGVEGFWNDMNEIATWGHMLPENIEMDFDGDKSSMRRGRNLYGFLMARSTYEGTKALLKGKRPFNLTRSGYSGVQRYGAVWTGDNVAYDEHMIMGARMVSNMGLGGIAFAGYDVGGFVGDANTRLYARWVSIGAFAPFFRGHAMINSRDSEPWAYGEETEQISRNYIKFRYQLLPYIYSLFYEAVQTGMPVQRALVLDYTFDQKIYDGQFYNQYLFGPSILVAPVESTKDLVKVYLPEGKWYSLYDGKTFHGNSEIIVECPVHRLPVFVKAGALLPMQPTINHTQQISDTLILHVYTGASSSFLYYTDDGSTFAYQTGAYAKREIFYDDNLRQLRMEASEGSYAAPWKNLEVIVHGLEKGDRQVNVNNDAKTLEPRVNRFFSPLEKFDPIYDPEPAPQENVHGVSLPYSSGAIIIRW